MKTFLSIVSLLLVVTSFNVFSQGISIPRTPSPAAMVSQTIGISTVVVKYSRPSVNKREIWGALVPYGWNVEGFGNGNKSPWRAGANENTVIEFSHPSKVEGTEVPAGSYGLFFVVNDDNTAELILSKDYKSWGSYFYDSAQDQMRAQVQLKEIPHTEQLTFNFTDLTKNSAVLTLNWEKKQFPVKIELAVDDIVMSNAADELKGPIGFTWQGYSSAANYALQNNLNTEQALEWIDRAIAQNKNFTTLNIKSGLFRQVGKEAEADKLLEEALAVASEPEINTYGYQLLQQGNHDKSIEIFTLNTKRFPKSANVWDSLGEAYFVKGDKKNAIKNFKKSINMNPPANVKANSEKFLKQLGAL
ncbi:MAG TPA: DUF2911 domain-containing protein [Cytophagales bacterium]|nr:DUF2911 domain-containing protein [Cytophagales bacterium]